MRVNLGHAPFQFFQVHGGADAGNHILALGVQQKVSVKNLLASGRVAREANTCSRIRPGIAKNHLHDIYCGTQQAGNIFDAPVRHSLLRHPRFKNRANRTPELLAWIVQGKSRPVFSLKYALYIGDQFLPMFSSHLSIVRNVRFFL